MRINTLLLSTCALLSMIMAVLASQGQAAEVQAILGSIARQSSRL